MKGDASVDLCPSINQLHLQVSAFPLAKVRVYWGEMVIKKRGEEEGKIKGLGGRKKLHQQYFGIEDGR